VLFRSLVVAFTVLVLVLRYLLTRIQCCGSGADSSGGMPKKAATTGEDCETRASARPQLLRRGDVAGGDIEMWPDRWGMSHAQVKYFLAECQTDRDWHGSYSMYDVVDKYVKPRTAGTGLGLALLQNQTDPLEVNVMVSHAWAENAEEFVKALELSVSEVDVLFICAFSLYQCQDGAGPSIVEQLGSHASESPFHRILEHIRGAGRRFGVLWRWEAYLRAIPGLLALMAVTWLYLPLVTAGCIPTMHNELGFVCYRSTDTDDIQRGFILGALSGKWIANGASDQDTPLWVDPSLSFTFCLICGGAALVVYALIRICTPYHGRMLVVPNRECDLYTRLWCMYEIFIASTMSVPMELTHSLAKAGGCSSREATCGSIEDTERIRGEIQDFGTRSMLKCSFKSRNGNGESGYGAVDKAIQRTKRQARNRVLSRIILQAWPSMLSMASIVRVLIIVPNGAQGWWMLQVAGSFVLGNCLGFFFLFRVAKHREGRPSQCDIILLGLAFLAVGLTCEGLVHFISGWDGGSILYSFMWLAMVGLTYMSISISIAVLLLLRRLPCRPSLAFAKVELPIHFLLVPFSIFGVAGVVGAATTALYTVIITSVFVCFPATLLRAAIAWGVRLKD